MANRSLRLDERQAAAVAARRNAVVTAGAGSGKTRVLAERYLRLVLEDRVPVDAILTLTFTRKAAAEMYERIYHSLAASRDDPFVAEQLGHFETAQISTVDSFCGRIARNGCTRFGVPTSFRVDEEEVDRLAEDAALAFLLDHRSDPVLARFIALNGFESVWREGLAELARSYVLVSRRQDPASLLQTQLGELGRLYRARRSELETVTATLAGLEPAVKAIGKAQAAFDGVALEADWDPRVHERDPEGLAAFLEAAGRIDGRTGRSAADSVLTYKECLAEIRRIRGEIATLVDTFRAREELAALYRLVGEFEEQVRAEKRRRGLLSYRDVMELAVDLLKQDTSLRAYYGRRFSFIMIDEFQDNNELQKQLLFLLSLRDGAEPGPGGEVAAQDLDPGKLFFVGDEKQSIYRFRGADVSVFKRLSNELAAAGGVSLELPYNYRSTPALISFFNAVFERAMGAATADYEARFAPLAAPDGSADEDRIGVRIAWKPFEEDGGEADTEVLDRDQAEAYYVARTIREAVDEGRWTVRDENGARAAGFDDVAVLMRSTSNQRHFERMLRLFGVPYSTQSVRSLFESAPAYDIYNVVQLCVRPEDSAAYAAVLRGPFVGVSDDALARVLLAGEAEPFCGAAAVELGEADAAKYRAGAALYADVRGRLDTEPVSAIVADLWFRYGYRYRLLANPSHHPYLEYYDHLYELARSMDDRPAVEFVDAVRENLGVYGRRRELEVVRDEQRGVQLMSVHKSKGLEFPVVVLANTGNMGRHSGLGSRPFYVSQHFGLTASVAASGSRLADASRVNYFYVEGERENAEMDLAELKRLLYVALTRAQAHLLVTGVFNSKNREQEGHLLNQLLAALGVDPANPQAGTSVSGVPIDIDLIPDVPRARIFTGGGPRAGVAPAVALEHYRRAERIERSATPRELTVSALAERFAAAGLDAAPSPDIDTGAADGTGAGPAGEEPLPAVESDDLIEERGLSGFFGTLCHYLIETALSGDRAGALAVPALGELPPGLRREALRREVGEEEYRRLAADAVDLVGRFRSSDLGAALARAEHESEVPFVLHREIGGVPVWIRGQIDLVARGSVHAGAGADAGDTGATGAPGRTMSASELTVVDFKTDRTFSRDAHRLQLALYREAAGELYGGPARAFVYYLRNGRVEEAGPMPELGAQLLRERPDQASKTR